MALFSERLGIATPGPSDSTMRTRPCTSILHPCLVTILACGWAASLSAAANAGIRLAATPPAHANIDREVNYANPQSKSDFNLPQIGQAGDNAITPAKLYRIGVQIMSQFREEGAILNDPLVEDYINNLGHELSSHSDNPTLHFRYFVLNDPEINSITLPGGFIGVYSGLFLDTDNEDELAGVMAHETGHVTQNHIARSIADSKSRRLLDIATMLGAILVAANAGDPYTAMGTVAGAQASIIQHRINFTRSEEAEADRVGIQTLARAGFPPQGMIDFFKKMQRDDALNGYNQIPQFLLDHPLDRIRMAELENRALSMHVPPRPSSRDYAIMKARLRVLESNNPDKTVAFFKTGVASSHGWDREAMRYGLALAEVNTNHTSDAITILQRLRNKYDDVVAFRVSLADAQMAAGETVAAEATYQRALQLFPDSRPLALSYGRSLIEANQAQTAINLLLPLTLASHSDPGVLRLIAKAYSRLGNSAESHYYMAEYYFNTGLPSQAASQLRIALATPGIDQVQKERFQVRLERLKAWGRTYDESLKSKHGS